MYRDVPWQTVNEAYRELEAEGELTVRVYEQCNFTELSELKAFVEAGNVTAAVQSFLRSGLLRCWETEHWEPELRI